MTLSMFPPIKLHQVDLLSQCVKLGSARGICHKGMEALTQGQQCCRTANITSVQSPLQDFRACNNVLQLGDAAREPQPI